MIMPALVLKNFIPLYKKVQILHKQHGKIICIYPQNHIARQLTTGSLILCDVELMQYVYRFEYLDICTTLATADFEFLQFMHEIIKICVKLIPDNVGVEDIFDFVMYLHQHGSQLSAQGKKIAKLRLFMMCDVLPGNADLYKMAMQDPCSVQPCDTARLDTYLQMGYRALLASD